MSSEERQKQKNKEIDRRFVEEFWNEKNLSIADEIFTSDCVPHGLHYVSNQSSFLRIPLQPGPEHIKPVVTLWYAAFPGWQGRCEELMAEGDKVAEIHVSHGTHKGEFMGIPATGKHVTFAGMRVFRIADGKIAEYWHLWDWQGLCLQLSATPK